MKLKCRERSTVIERNSIKTITGKEIYWGIENCWQIDNQIIKIVFENKKYIEVDDLIKRLKTIQVIGTANVGVFELIKELEAKDGNW